MKHSVICSWWNHLILSLVSNMSWYTNPNRPLLVATVLAILNVWRPLMWMCLFKYLIPTNVPCKRNFICNWYVFHFRIMFCIICTWYHGVDFFKTLVVHDSSLKIHPLHDFYSESKWALCNPKNICLKEYQNYAKLTWAPMGLNNILL